jgi:hypothetical protein
LRTYFVQFWARGVPSLYGPTPSRNIGTALVRAFTVRGALRKARRLRPYANAEVVR